MKIKFLGFEGSFDKEDAYIVLPFVFWLAALFLTSLDKVGIIIVGIIYYALYTLCLFWPKIISFIKSRCPKCKSRKLVLLGLQNYKGDAPYYWYQCQECNTTLVELNSSLIDPNSPNKKNKLQSAGFSDEIPF